MKKEECLSELLTGLLDVLPIENGIVCLFVCVCVCVYALYMCALVLCVSVRSVSVFVCFCVNA